MTTTAPAPAAPVTAPAQLMALYRGETCRVKWVGHAYGEVTLTLDPITRPPFTVTLASVLDVWKAE